MMLFIDEALRYLRKTHHNAWQPYTYIEFKISNERGYVMKPMQIITYYWWKHHSSEDWSTGYLWETD